MEDYENGKIYKIVGEDGTTYYGSTTLSLKQRKGQHPHDPKTTAYKKIITQMDWDIFLVENYPCESKKQLLKREGYYIRENPCVNRCIAGRSKREWYEDNLEYCKKYQEKYRETHRKHRRDTEFIRNKWIRSFGDPRRNNCLQRCDPSLFQ